MIEASDIGPRTRFAPSPTGQLHVGTARVALFNWLYARSRGGRFLLRIEDTDAERSRREYEVSILADLRWLGLDWDEGPDKGGSHQPYRQSERGESYREAAARLLAAGQVYRCFCTPEEVAAMRREDEAAGRLARYPGRCRDLDPAEVAARLGRGRAFGLRFRAPHQVLAVKDRIKGEVTFPADIIEDFVVLRSNGQASYNFACVVDDAAMRISHVIRGEDLLPSTPKQVLLYRALGYEPPVFAHLPMILGPDHVKLSKRRGARSMSSLREAGYLPEAVVNGLALLGWSAPDGRDCLEVDELIRLFSLDRAGRSNAVFDVVKLNWLNGQHLRRKSAEELLALAGPSLERAGVVAGPMDATTAAWLGEALKAAAQAAESIGEAVDRLRSLWHDHHAAEGDAEVARLGDDVAAREIEVLRVFAELAAAVPLAEAGRFRELMREVGERVGLTGQALFHPLRVALTGEDSGMELDKLVPLMAAAPRSLKPGLATPLERVQWVLERARRRSAG